VFFTGSDIQANIGFLNTGLTNGTTRTVTGLTFAPDLILTAGTGYSYNASQNEGRLNFGCATKFGTIKNSTSVFRMRGGTGSGTTVSQVFYNDKYIDGNLAGLPWKLALSLKERGWILRSDIIWYKPNAMPSSVKNRPTTDHEYIFLFAKSSKYYYDADSIREPHVTFSEKSKMKGGRNHLGKAGGTPELGKNGGNSNLHKGRWDQAFHPKGRNKRTVWEVPLSKFRDAHFAVFPEQLIEPCILAGSPEGGIILDPFFGAGTVGLVSINKGRKFIGIDINHQYCEIAAKRIFH
jgi:hypothetical protein